jgi:hypothetical protein
MHAGQVNNLVHSVLMVVTSTHALLSSEQLITYILSVKTSFVTLLMPVYFFCCKKQIHCMNCTYWIFPG